MGSVSKCQPSAHWAGPERLGPVGAGRALTRQGGPARDQYLFDLAGFGVDAAELDRVQAGAVGFGDRPYRVAGGGVGEPVGSGGALRSLAPSVLPASVLLGLEFGDDGGGLFGGEAVQMQMLMPRAVNCGQTGTGGQELGLQLGDRLPQRHRVGEHRPGRVVRHDRPAVGTAFSQASCC